MIRSAWTVAWYRFRATSHSRRGGYLSVILLVGLVGGVAMGAIAAARRTQSSFPAYIASTNPSDFGAVTAVINPLIGSTLGYDPTIVRKIAHLRYVRKVGSASGLDVLPLGPHDVPTDLNVLPAAAGNGLGSDNGYGFNQDRLTVVQGRLPDPRSVHDVAVLTAVAQILHVHLGQHILMGVYTNAQTNLPAFGTAKVTPYRKIDVTVTALVLQPQNLVADDVDNSESLAFFTPAFTQPFLACCSNYTISGIQVAGPAHFGQVDTELQGLLPPNFPAPIVGSTTLAKAERAIKPESIALGAFGIIAAIAALLITAQVIGRQTRLATDDLRTLQALGADPVTTTMDGLIGIVGAVVIGAVLAVGVAVGLSPLAPIGPVRPVDPTPGISFDATVLGLGFAALVVGLTALAVVFSYRAVPRLADARRRRSEGRRSGAANAAASLGLPAPAVTGVRFALEPGVGRNAVPVRSAILGAALAVIVVVDHGHVLHQPQCIGVASPPLWMELGRHPVGGRRVGKHPRPPRHPTSSTTTTPCCRGRARTPTTSTSTDRSSPSWGNAPARRYNLPCCPGSASRGRDRSCWVPSPWPNCTSTSATPSPSGPERDRPAR